MASGPYPDPRRGTWAVQWFDGTRWRRTVVVRRRPGWKPGMPMPRKPPPETAAALAEYTRKEQQCRRDRPADPLRSIVDFLTSYRHAFGLGHAASSCDALEATVKLFLDWCSARKPPVVRLDQVTAMVAQEWLDARAGTASRKTGRPISYARLKMERALLATAWARAVKRREIPANVWHGTEIPVRPVKRPKGSWTPDQYRELIDAARPWLKDVVMVGVHTGLRISALLAMEWGWVRWARTNESGFGEIVVPSEHDKCGRGYSVPLHATCHDVLARRLVHRDVGHERVLTGEAGRPAHTTVVATSILRACRRAGLTKPSSPCHHMRRTFGRWAVLGHLTGRPVPIYVASKWLGHSSVKMTEVYLSLDPEDSTRWMENQ